MKTSKIWILKRSKRWHFIGENDDSKNNEFLRYADEMIVIAPDEKSARKLAAKNALCEFKESWLYKKYSSCNELKPNNGLRVLCIKSNSRY